jgi:membrane-bound serine protease (ClpP class)
MNDILASAAAYGIALIAIWLFTRKSKSGYVRWQWRRPHWILARLLLVVVMLHGVFALAGTSAAKGYLFVVLICFVAYSGIVGLLVMAVGFVFYEWVFWFPSRHELILRTRKSIEADKQEHLIGQLGQTLSDLKLVGRIEVNGQKYYARSESGLVRKGEKVMVSSVGDFELVVRPVDN